MTKYYISGDGTGITYGIHICPDESKPFKTKIIESGLKSFDVCQRRIRELEKKELDERNS